MSSISESKKVDQNKNHSVCKYSFGPAKNMFSWIRSTFYRTFLMERINPFEALPVELISKVVSFLGDKKDILNFGKAIANFGRVCRQAKEIALMSEHKKIVAEAKNEKEQTRLGSQQRFSNLFYDSPCGLTFNY